MYPYKKILVAVDLSEASELVITRTKALAALFSAELSLVHTVEPLPAYGYPGFDDLQTPIADRAKEGMDKLAKALNVPAERVYLEFGAVKHEIIKIAEKINADLIVIGSHGRHGLSRLLGSGANAIVHGVHCDVLTVRCQDE
jgi:universal stress protein A